MFKVNPSKKEFKTLQEFIKKWSSLTLPSKELLYDYKKFCKNLLYYDQELVVQTIDLLKKNITLWAEKNSIIYKNKVDYISKEVLVNKKFWYVDSIEKEFRNMSTSGSTSGKPFTYLAWKPFFEFIESNNHYDMILDEFGIRKNADVLFFFPSSYTKNKFITVTKDDVNFVQHHGLARKTQVHYVNNETYNKNPEELFDFLFGYLQRNKIDVFFAPGPNINSLCHFMRKLKFKGKIASLLSNSNEMLLQADVDFLLNGKYVDNICDHMRCWDGGATFFTCKESTYHLCDNLSWSEEIDGKLITTDYFSLPSPFIKYWNGDLCKIFDKYRRCECGRLFRNFEFVESRPFSLKGLSIEKYKKEIIESGISSLKQVKCSVAQIEVVTDDDLTLDEKEKIKKILDKFNVKFTVEKEVRSIEYALSDKEICGSSVAECVVDASDVTGETYSWKMISGCDKESNDNNFSCEPNKLVDGSPCVFFGSKTNVPCDHLPLTNTDNKIIFSVFNQEELQSKPVPKPKIRKLPQINKLKKIKTKNKIVFSFLKTGCCFFKHCVFDSAGPEGNQWHEEVISSQPSEENSCDTSVLPPNCNGGPTESGIVWNTWSPDPCPEECTGNCDYFCFEFNTPTLQGNTCSNSNGCGCPTLSPIESQCAPGTAFQVSCVVPQANGLNFVTASNYGFYQGSGTPNDPLVVNLGMGMNGPPDSPFTTSTMTFVNNGSGTLNFNYFDNIDPPDISSGYVSVDGINLGVVQNSFNSGTFPVTAGQEIFISFSGGGFSSLDVSMYVAPIT